MKNNNERRIIERKTLKLTRNNKGERIKRKKVLTSCVDEGQATKSKANSMDDVILRNKTIDGHFNGHGIFIASRMKDVVMECCFEFTRNKETFSLGRKKLRSDHMILMRRFEPCFILQFVQNIKQNVQRMKKIKSAIKATSAQDA